MLLIVFFHFWPDCSPLCSQNGQIANSNPELWLISSWTFLLRMKVSSLTFGRHVVTIRTLVGCKYRHALRAKHLGSRGFFFLWRLVWTASALDHLLICCLAPNTEDVIISSAYQRCRVHIVRYCVAAELEDFDRDSRTDGLVYMAMFLEFLRQSKTSLWNTLGTLKKRNTPRR